MSFHSVFFQVLGPEIVLGGLAIFLLFIEKFIQLKNTFVRILLFTGIAASILLCSSDLIDRAAILDNIYIYNRYTVFFQLLLLGYLAVITAKDDLLHIPNSRDSAEHISTILFAVIGSMLVAGAVDIFLVYIGFELTFISLLLLGINNRIRRKNNAFSRILFPQFFGSASMLFGISLVFSITRSTHYQEISHYISRFGVSHTPLLGGGILFFCLGAMLKSGIFPFHHWISDDMETTDVQLILLTVILGLISFFSAAGRFLCSVLWIYRAMWAPLLAVISVFFLIFGYLSAFHEKDPGKKVLKLLFTQQGFLFAGLATLIHFIPSRGAPGGLAAMLFHITTLSIVIALFHVKPMSFTALITISFFPATMGFISLFHILSATIQVEYYVLTLFITLSAVLGSFVSIQQLLSIPRENLFSFSFTVQNILTVLLSTLAIGLGIAPGFLTEIVRIVSKAVWL